MKGIVFTTFNEMIEDEMGITVWEKLLQKVQPSSKGIYTSVKNYSDQELFDLIEALSGITKIPKTELIKYYGDYLFSVLIQKYPTFTDTISDYFEFLDSIENVIHVEVRKLYENPNLPTLLCKKVNDKELIMRYESPRQLCHLAEGLVQGAAKYYEEDFNFRHSKCVHQGDECCEFFIKR